MCDRCNGDGMVDPGDLTPREIHQIDQAYASAQDWLREALGEVRGTLPLDELYVLPQGVISSLNGMSTFEHSMLIVILLRAVAERTDLWSNTHA